MWVQISVLILVLISMQISVLILVLMKKCYRTREEAGQVVETNLPEIMVKILG